jgi:hypothetical protein
LVGELRSKFADQHLAAAGGTADTEQHSRLTDPAAKEGSERGDSFAFGQR